MTHSSMQRPTMLAVLARPAEEAAAPGGTMATTAWRGVRTALVTLRDGDNPSLAGAIAHSVRLLGVESHFHWAITGERAGEAVRLARIFRALQPGAILTNRDAQPLVEAAWEKAKDLKVAMPGLSPFNPDQSRLWLVVRAGAGTARVDSSAARPLLRALRFYYTGTSHETVLPPLRSRKRTTCFEWFTLLRGRQVPATGLVDDLFVGLHPSPPRPHVSFLAEELDESCTDSTTKVPE